jgi:hypothetical protein
MAAVDSLPAHVVGPRAPDTERVSIEFIQIVPSGPQVEHGTIDEAVGFVTLAVEGTGPAPR